MARAVQALKVRPDCVLVDGCNRPPDLLAPGETWTRGTKEERRRAEELKSIPKLSKWFTAVKKAEPETPKVDEPWRPKRVEAVIHGDALVPSISAASVLAKVHRDRLMEKLHEQYPAYGFVSNQGYGTEEHMQAIRSHGPCPEHRRSFGPIREILGLEPLEGAVDAPSQQKLGFTGDQTADSKVVTLETIQAIPTPQRQQKRSSEDLESRATEDTVTEVTPPKKQRNSKKAEGPSNVKPIEAPKRRGRPTKAKA